MCILAVIPARYASSRFPGKPLADRTGKPLIQHVVEQVRCAHSVDRIIVATDDQRIVEATGGFGCEVMMTRQDHPNGTSRIAEVVGRLSNGPKLVVNVQGDEPQIEPELIDQLVECLGADRVAPMATLASEFAVDEDPVDPNIVKVVTAMIGGHRRAIYFSRSLIPYRRGNRDSAIGNWQFLKHPGLYVYRRDFLLEYVKLEATPLEQAEQLEQLRALEHGIPIAVHMADTPHHGIDTPQQYEAFVQWYGKRHRAPKGV